ncbi:MAG: transglutaminaseTgpA domain-containing protein, partial [Planctomycetota bacterium]
MRLLSSFPLLAFALMLLSIVGLCVAQQSVELLLVAGALAAMSWYVTEGPRGRFLPRWVSTVLVIAVCLNLGVELVYGAVAWERALGRFAVWMTLIKLYERKTARDYAQLLLLSLLLMIVGTAQSVELMFGVVLLLYALLGLYVLLLFQLQLAHEEARTSRRDEGPVGYRLVPPVKPIIGRHVSGQFRLLAVGIGASGLGLSVLVFLIFPRDLGQGLVPQLDTDTGLRRVGFNEFIDLRTGTRITDSRRVVLSMQLLDETGRP